MALRVLFVMSLRTIRNSILIGAATLIGGTTPAQYAWDFGVHLGAANYLGEMGGTDQLDAISCGTWN